MKNKTRLFIDGEAGTTGLKIHERLEKKTDIELLKIAPELRKDASARAKMLNAADYVFLCLPDDAAREAVALIDNPSVKVIDASTAHRTNKNWAYGFPELSSEHEERIRDSKRVAVPGCYASGFIALIYPLVLEGFLNADEAISCFGISGYSGAGKAFISEYESPERNPELGSARLYALTQSHKHQPEMQKICGLKHQPMFNPIIDDYYSGLLLSVPLQPRSLKSKISVDEIKSLYKRRYTKGRVRYIDGDNITFLAANTLADTDDMELYVFGNDERILLTARFDNLGKGASGAAVQCYEIMSNK
ncbi:MAG: N-acetyl-gamma-glutamyl-phosphate reductase [Oscillospiraceae bacterium]|nr:N-acetyl-gamma-glutamyl-phosphate reductase [Oscillospiraceae bacterium]